MTDAPTERGEEGAWTSLRRRKVVQWGLGYAAVAWAALQGIEYLGGTFDWPRAIQRWATVALILALPIVVTLAWYHGDKGEQRVNRSELAVLTVLLLLGGGALWWFAQRGTPADVAETATAGEPPVPASSAGVSAAAGPSIAVLPFENRSRLEEDAFFVDGIHDDILTQLAKVSALKVISRTSVEKFRDTELSTKEIAAQLGVTSLLEGGVQRAGERVRITVQLIDTATDAHLWAESYDRELTATNIFAIQSEVAGAIAVALRTTLSAGEKASVNAVPTQSLEAWEAYQRGKQRMARRTSAAVAESVEYFQKAIAADPGFALAYVGLADALLIQVFYEYAPRTDSLASAEKVIGKALELDPNLAGAHTSLGRLLEYLDDNERAEVEYRRAIELNPNYATAYHWYAFLLANEGRLGEALRAAEDAEALDPLSAIINNMVAVALDRQGRFDEAFAGYKKALHNDPAMPVIYANVAALQSDAYGRLDLAAPFLEKAAELDPSDANAPARVVWLYLDLGDDKRAEQWLTRAMQRGASGVVANDPAAFWYLFRGEQDKALAFARRSFEIEPRRSAGLALLRDADLALGNWQAARVRYAKAFPELLGATPARIDGQNYRAAVDLAVVLQQSGERERADQLLDSSEAFIRTIPRMGQGGYWMTDAQIFALRGQKREAVDALREAEKAGWRGSWRYVRDFDPALNSIRDDVEFKAVFADIERDMARQRAELAARPKDAPLDLAIGN